MQFKVPQFIDMEDKVLANLSFRQFAYLGGGAGLAYLALKILPGFISLFVVPALIGLALALAFIKINEKPFAHTLESFIRYYAKSRLYLWKQLPHEARKDEQRMDSKKSIRDTMTESKLKTLSWSLDVIDSKKK
jgi:hypothetical protein